MASLHFCCSAIFSLPFRPPAQRICTVP
jgi:hypothetical protein